MNARFEIRRVSENCAILTIRVYRHQPVLRKGRKDAEYQ